MKLNFEYGQGTMAAELPDNTDVFIPGETVKDPAYIPEDQLEAAYLESLAHPIGMPTLTELAGPGKTVTIVVPDRVKGGEQATSHRKLSIKYILKELYAAGIEKKDILFIISNGLHPRSTEADAKAIFGEELFNEFWHTGQIISHDSEDQEHMVYLGTTHRGDPVYMNKYVFECDIPILIGHVQGNPYGGYSGGYKHSATGITNWRCIASHHVPSVMRRDDFTPVNGGSLMRALFSDFPEDKKVTDMGDEYMFGKSILVAPVISEVKRRSLYLPEGTQWIDFWTGEKQKGGQEISREAPIDIIPLYVKAGSIIPAGPSVQFATEKSWDDLQVRIYPGADGEFTLYEDEDDNYNYEKGKYTTVRMTWSDKDRQLTIHPRQGSYDGMLQNRNFRIVVVDNLKGLGLDNESYTVNVEYKGKKLNIKLP